MTSLRDFLQTGVFGALKIGDSRSRVAAILSAPPCWSSEIRAENAAIWKYGAWEFYFEKDALWMIFTDNFRTFSLRETDFQNDDFSPQMTLPTVRERLEIFGVKFHEQAVSFLENGVEILCDSGVRLRFEAENKSPPRLISICQR